MDITAPDLTDDLDRIREELDGLLADAALLAGMIDAELIDMALAGAALALIEPAGPRQPAAASESRYAIGA